MLIGDFNKDIIDMDIAQFAIAIVLDYEGEYRASEAILGYYNKLTEKTPYFDPSCTLQEKGRIRDNIYNNILYESRTKKKSFLMLFIEYLYENKVIYAVTRNRVYNTMDRWSLKDLVVQTSVDKLYASCMRLLFKIRTDELITCYMRTNRFRKFFIKWLQRTYPVDNFGRKNIFDEATVNALLEVIISRIYKYSRNAYQIDTMQPNRFIHFTLNNYFKDEESKHGNEDSDVTKFFKILNSYGQDREVEGEDSDSSTTALAFEGIDVSKKKSNFDFISVANRICKASLTIFDYKGSKTAYYDLFSKYRDDEIDKSAEAHKKLLRELVGIQVSLFKKVDCFSVTADMDINTVKQKAMKRKHYLTLLNILITHGVDVADLQNLFAKQIEYTKLLNPRDGIRLYKTDTGSKKSETNGEIFRILYDGMLALKEFLDFIDSDENTYSITLYNFNTDIFRNMEYIRRFKSLKDYLKYGNHIKKIVDEANTRPRTGELVNTDLLTNDEMYNLITTSDIFRNNPIFKSLQSVSLSYINEVLYKRNKENENGKFIKEFTELTKLEGVRYLGKFGLYGVKDGTADYYRAVLLQTLFKLKELFSKGDFSSNEAIRYIQIFLSNLELTMKCEGHPVCDDTNHYNLEFGSNDVFLYLDEMKQDFSTPDGKFDNAKFNSHRQFRTIFARTIFDAWFPENTNLEFSEKLRVLFTINRLIQNFDYKLHNLYLTIYNNKDDINLAYIHITQFIDLLKIKLPIVKLSTLINLDSSDKISYQINAAISEKIKLDSVRDRLVLKFINLYFKTRNDEFTFLKNLLENINSVFSLSFVAPKNYKVDNILSKAHESLIANYAIHIKKLGSGITSQLDLRLKNCKSDDIGILMLGYKRYNFNIENGESSYIHKKGFVIIVDEINESFKVRPLTEDDFARYKTELEIYNANTN